MKKDLQENIITRGPDKALLRMAMNPVHSNGFVLARAADAFDREARKRLSPIGLTHTQVIVLTAIAVAQGEMERISNSHGEVPRGGPSQREVAKTATIDEMTASQVIRKLAAIGHVKRGKSRGGNSIQVVLTKAGVTALEEGLKLLIDLDRALFADRVEDGDLKGMRAALWPLITAR